MKRKIVIVMPSMRYPFLSDALDVLLNADDAAYRAAMREVKRENPKGMRILMDRAHKGKHPTRENVADYLGMRVSSVRYYEVRAFHTVVKAFTQHSKIAVVFNKMPKGR